MILYCPGNDFLGRSIFKSQAGAVQFLDVDVVCPTQRLGEVLLDFAEDPDAKAAAGYLSYPPDVWIYDPKVSWWAPTAPSITAAPERAASRR